LAFHVGRLLAIINSIAMLWLTFFGDNRSYLLKINGQINGFARATENPILVIFCVERKNR
jgi:hypothetical protein